MKKYSIIKCIMCGAWVYENWYIRHTKANCKIGRYPSQASIDGGYHETTIISEVGVKNAESK
jgi:hypothetical protein